MPEAILRLEDVVRDFKRQTETIHAVRGVSLEIRRGTFNILCGRSGSGKTTLLNMIAAIDLPTSGKIFFEDQEITRMKSAERDALRRKKIGIIFQNTALIAQMTALENVEFALSVAGIKPGKRRRQAVDWLEQMGIRERKNHMPAEMSGGEQARVAIGRALAHEPILLLADEPTSELDTKTSFRVIDMFRSLVDTNGLTIVMTTHDVNIMGAADLIYTMEDGVIIDVK
ncbi:MAG TPA: macrolide ABC transporter ATP-binding protein [Clostridiales bacterium]|uniref:ABC transporter ATP-binding protein n=1 Tax=Candidatus Egerieisoma faecipullorum TaxID=2840963 RepID=A0A9D1I6T4_9CLOT|nr:macrolide ABC transporter ATP-binding protein [Clostridiales bacterium]HIU29201.1 ABC transporter ATP-binding protein [Candidatus Egerieisoma faecipullorum]